ncbi:hypothetical protein BT93_H3762 [Corymbia citriodora subsp. variegata]|nr:hypothetical protein BT93_H3762 [Corymbia citriodora subsp. variegata]
MQNQTLIFKENLAMETRNLDNPKTLDFVGIFCESFGIALFHRKLFAPSSCPPALLSFLFMGQTPEISFKKIVGVVPKLWKKLTVTFIWASAILLAYHVIAWSALNLRVVIENTFLFVVLSTAHTLGFVYIFMVWNMADVVSVLENVDGNEAITKSNAVVKHNIGTGLFAYFYSVPQLLILFSVLFDVVVRESASNRNQSGVLLVDVNGDYLRIRRQDSDVLRLLVYCRSP